MWQFASETGERTFLNQLTPAKPKADQYIDRIRKKKNYYEKFNCLLTSLVSLSHFFCTCDHAKATTPQDATDRKIVSLKSLHANCSKNSRTHLQQRYKYDALDFYRDDIEWFSFCFIIMGIHLNGYGMLKKIQAGRLIWYDYQGVKVTDTSNG